MLKKVNRVRPCVESPSRTVHAGRADVAQEDPVIGWVHDHGRLVLTTLLAFDQYICAWQVMTLQSSLSTAALYTVYLCSMA